MSQSTNPEEVRLDPALAALKAGLRVGGGRFTLFRLLGQGGMGVVWLARDEHLREDVALKFLPPEIRHDAAALDDLRRETSRSRKLTHAHIIRIHDLYKVEQEAFISMEYVDGPNLSELRLEQPDRVLKWAFLEPLIQQLCDALDHAHRENIVHRDLKPANMMLDGRRRLKLADFGVAAMVSDSVSRVSLGRHLLSGTASYMSPQQLDGQLPHPTDDIYSLGSTLYELLTSRAPFFTGDIAHQVRTLPPQAIDKRLAQLRINNPVPSAVVTLIMTCLAKEPEKRPQSARAVAEQLGLGPVVPAVGNGSAAESPSPKPSPAPPRSEAKAEPVSKKDPPAPVLAQPEPPTKKLVAPLAPLDPVPLSPEPAEPARKRSRLGPVLATLLTLIAVAGASWWWWQHRTPAVQTQRAPAPPAPEFVSLFNGLDFAGWDGDPNVWFVKDGAIATTNGVSRDRRPVALFWRGSPVDDFELRLSFRVLSGNSGIYYRAKRLSGYEVGGYQFEISGPATGNLLEIGQDRLRREPSRRGSVTIAQVVDGKEQVTVERPTDASALELRDAFHAGGWNTVVIIARGNHVTHQLNGHTIVECTDEYEKRPRNGTLALEVYGRDPTNVQFRDIRLKRLSPQPAL